MARVVLDARAVPELAHHLQVERGALAKARGLQHSAVGLHLADPLFHLGLDVDHRLLELVGRGHEVGGGIDAEVLPLGQQLTGQRIDLVMRSTSSPKNSTRTTRSSEAGWTSRVSPRTRNGRTAAMSLRWYCRAMR